jgi:hypothetical protein
MKKNIIILSFALLLSFCIMSDGHSAVQYGNYVNNNYNYAIIIPISWNREELTLSSKHFMYAVKDANTEIKVRAFKSATQDIEKTAHAKTWDLRKIDPRLNKILETEKIEIKKNIKGKLLIFEYKSKKNNILQRTLITKNSGIIYIIECKSPKYLFYKYEDIFTTAFASFKYIQSGGIENSEDQKSETAAPEPEIKEEPKSNSSADTTEELEEDEQL